MAPISNVETNGRLAAVRPSDRLDDRFLHRTSPKWDRHARQAGFRDLGQALEWAHTVRRSRPSIDPIGLLSDRLGIPYSVLISVKVVWRFFVDRAEADRHPVARHPDPVAGGVAP